MEISKHPQSSISQYIASLYRPIQTDICHISYARVTQTNTRLDRKLSRWSVHHDGIVTEVLNDVHNLLE